MILLWSIFGTASAVFGVFAAIMTLRVWRSNSNAYNANRIATGSFLNAALGRILPRSNDNMTDFHVNHFAEPVVAEDGAVSWERAGSLSDEAVDRVLARH